MNSTNSSPLSAIEPRLRQLLPEDLNVAAWITPSADNLTKVFGHLRTLHRILHDYVPRRVADEPPQPGVIRYKWQEGTLMFTDLAGFTALMEANAARGRAGAEALLRLLNNYFAKMIEIVSKSGGDLLEFTGDALLVVFPADQRSNETVRAVRAGMRMQRAMKQFENIETSLGSYSLRMRVGIHHGRFLNADIGTPHRMEHVLLGRSLQRAKQAEGAGEVGRVCLTQAAFERVKDQFRFASGQPGFKLIVDDISTTQLGEYEAIPPSRRLASAVLWDRSISALVSEIEKQVTLIEPLACYLPRQVLKLVVDGAAQRQIPPHFPVPTVVFVNLIGLPESVDHARSDEETLIVQTFSQAISMINAAVEARGGVLKKVTYHLTGSDMMIFFGVPDVHTDDSRRAAEIALILRDIINGINLPTVGGQPLDVFCQIGLARGPVFAAEIGEPHGRREYNVLGDPVNTAARLMTRATTNQILVTGSIYKEIYNDFDIEPMGSVSLKGKTIPTPIYSLLGKK